MEYLMSGMALIMTVGALSCLLIGVVIGVIVGALPGLGSVVGITLCLPFTFSMDKVSAIALLLGVYAGSVYGGSISAVLINTPGTPASAATCFGSRGSLVRIQSLRPYEIKRLYPIGGMTSFAFCDHLATIVGWCPPSAAYLSCPDFLLGVG